MTVNNNTPQVNTQMGMPPTVGTDGTIETNGTQTPAAADAPLIQGVGVQITENTSSMRMSGVKLHGAPSKTVDLNEVPELDDEDVRGLVEILEDLEKLLAELKGESTEEQIAAAKERVASLKSKLLQQQSERLNKIDESMQKIDEANRAKQIQEASKWMNIALAIVGAVIAIAAAVAAVVTAGSTLGIVVAVFACIGAAASTANTGLTIYQEAASDSIKQDIKDKAAEYREQGMGAAEAMKKATEDVTDKFLIASIVLSGVSIVCGLVGSAGSAAGSAARVLSSIQTITGGLSLAGGILSTIATNNANDANYDAQMTEAELARLEALIEKLKKALEEDSDEIKALLQQLMEAMAELSKLLESAQETTDEITNGIGATA
jgi:hypothetical protein